MKNFFILILMGLCTISYSYDVLENVKRYLPESPKIIDAGAYQGGESISFIKIWPKATVYSFEPLPHNYDALKANTREYANINIYSYALQKRGYKIVSGTSDNHLFIVDLTDKGISGQVASKALEQAGIITSKSCVPNDSRKPWIGSGVRIGTPALTTRGMKEQEVEQIAAWFDMVIQHHDDQIILAEICKAVENLCAAFPIYS